MRVASLTALVLLLPALAWAAPLVNINTATTMQLETLKGVGPSKAQAIIEYRTSHGPFSRIEDIQEVKGIGPSTYAGLSAFITVDSAPAQPLSPATGSKQVQKKVELPVVSKVEPIISTSTNPHEEVVAPTAALEPAAVGAVVAPVSASSSNLFRSPWTLAGLVSVLVLAAVAFVFL